MGIIGSPLAGAALKLVTDPRIAAALALAVALGVQTVRLDMAAGALKQARAEVVMVKDDLRHANENIASLQAGLADQNKSIADWKAAADAAQAQSAQDRATAAKAMSRAQQTAGSILATQPASGDDCQAAKALLGVSQ